MLIGNDLVDLNQSRAIGKADDNRFIRRVFTGQEAECIYSASNPDRVLWAFWAAKEAAFKVVTKQTPGEPFRHRSYQVSMPLLQESASHTPEDGTRILGTVQVSTGGAATVFPVWWQISGAVIHCLATSRQVDPDEIHKAVDRLSEEEKGTTEPGEWSERERATIHSRESREVRRLARRLARTAGLGRVEVVRSTGERRPGPPQLYPYGASNPIEGWDLSLSHDGEWIGVALLSTAARAGLHIPASF